MNNKQIVDFSHVPNFTGYMRVVEEITAKHFDRKLKVLDLPAGNGLLSDALRKQGHTVVSADFNKERTDYDFVNMEEQLPYNDASFDLVVCLEGIEHIVEPYALIKEFSRITKSNGSVIITMPNVQSIYSRLKFLFTGTFYQFEPEGSRHPNGQSVDRGHISSLSLVQLDYLFGEQGLKLRVVSGDKIKKKILMPLYLLIALINKIYSTKKNSKSSRDVYCKIASNKCLLSRSLVTLWTK